VNKDVYIIYRNGLELYASVHHSSVMCCSQQTHVTNRNDPKPKTLTQKHSQLTRYAPLPLYH